MNPVHLCRCLATELQKRAFATLHPCEQDLISTLVKADYPELVDIGIHRTINLAHVVVLEKLFGHAFTVRFVQHVDPWAYPAGVGLPAPKLPLVATCVFRWIQKSNEISKVLCRFTTESIEAYLHSPLLCQDRPLPMTIEQKGQLLCHSIALSI